MTFGLGRLGASFGKLGAGCSVGSSTPAFSLTAPVLAFASATDPDSDNTQDFNATFSNDITGYYIRLVGTYGSATVGAFDIDQSNLIDAGEAGALLAAFTTGAIPNGAVAFKCIIQSGSGGSGGTAVSNWSNTVTKTITQAIPTLSSPVDTKTGNTTASGTVSTDVASGTLYAVITTSATSPTAAQVKAGLNHLGAAGLSPKSQAVTVTGVQTISGGFTGLSAATAYYAHYAQETINGYSNVSSADGFTTDSVFSPATLFLTYSGFWLDAALGTCSDQAGTTPVTSDGTTILNWKDQSGNARHWSAASAGPVRKNTIVNSLPVMRFAGAEKLVGSSLTGFGSAAEIFAVLKCNADPSPGISSSSIWGLGSDSSADHYPYTDGTAYMGAFSTVRKATGNPSATITAFHLLNIWSAASDWAMLINGTSHYSTVTNTVGFDTAPGIGKAPFNAYYFVGDFAEIICYNAKLTAGERTDVKAYIAAKYSLTIA